MQKSDLTDEPEESQRSRPSSRRSSVSLPRKNSLKKEKDKKSPLNTPSAHSAHSTPKRSARPSLDFMVTGKQILKRADRANSLPGSHRRQSSDSATSRPRDKKISERADESQASREPSLDDDLSLDLSQISDFEDGYLKHGKFPLATSTPKPSEVGIKSTPTPSEVGIKSTLTPSDVGIKSTLTPSEVGLKSTPTPSDVGLKSTPTPSEVSLKSTSAPRPGQKPRSASLQHMQQRVERRATTQQSVDSSRKSQQSVDLPSARSQQSVDLPSGRSQQSVDLISGRSQQSVDLPSGRSQQSVDLSAKQSRDSTFSYSRDSLYKTSSSASPYRYGTDYSSVSAEYSPSSAELSPRAEPSPSPLLSSWAEHTVEGGEWSSFWANYNNCPLPLPRPLSYDQCPTPYREHLDHTDFEFSGSRSRVRSPEGIKHIGDIIRSEGLRLSPRDAQRVLHCAHLLGSVLSRAVDARARTPTTCPSDDRRRTLTLDLKETSLPPPAPKTIETTTQTDISLPNTKSAPLIFESILRQLSKSSIDEPDSDKLESKESQNEK